VDLGQLQLTRFPHDPAVNLRAWDAADEYLLLRLAEEGPELAGQRVLVVNDGFGALATALVKAGAHVTFWSDSRISELSALENLSANGLAGDSLELLPGPQNPVSPPDLVLLKIPKNLSWWRDSLLRLRSALQVDTTILAGSMIKHTPRRAYTLLEECLGTTRTGRGWKKARLAEVDFDPDRKLPPGEAETTVEVPEFQLILRHRANVFSREKLDLGARLLLANLPAVQEGARVADLGCGSGVLGLALQRSSPTVKVLGVDESYQAVASARDSALASGLQVDFEVGVDLSLVPAGSLDLVLCNPPFHQDRVVGDSTARAMFAQAHEALRPGGELRIVGNRHLGYHARLKDLFGGCALVAENSKFVVLGARKQKINGIET
jgi:23S rRNA (guanine1835-N2)-methyltransferase